MRSGEVMITENQIKIYLRSKVKDNVNKLIGLLYGRNENILHFIGHVLVRVLISLRRMVIYFLKFGCDNVLMIEAIHYSIVLLHFISETLLYRSRSI